MDVKSPLGDVSTRGVDSLGQTVGTDSASTLSLLLVTTVSSSSGWLDGGGLQDSVPYNGSVYNMPSDEFDADTNVTGPIFMTPTYMLVWVTIANVLVFVTGVIGNTLVILVVTCVHDMKTATNLCLMNLSIADLLVLLICQPSALLEFYAEEKWMLGSFMCKLTVFLENAVTLASILIILSVSFERYLRRVLPAEDVLHGKPL
ncbi:growth hormone secretagogue receptor type 1-like [Pomacea canaliculata]|uniref:growth hormone secretagogue receptor type 1-like n=1 Tax=Pomacea canaliculata TaxID=400727 RepID=UPI000D72DE42|nr:growth hormone secretagogue receptor type 1-like [Pomacea canaliculata]